MGYLANEISQEREHWLELRPKDGSGAWDFYRWLSSRPTAAAAAKPAPDDYVLDGASADQAGSAEQERPKRGTFFDETVDIRDPEGHELAIAVLERVATSEPPRKRKRSASAQANQYALVRAILANGFRCHWHRDPGITSFFRKPDAGVYLKRDKPSWLSANAMQRALSALAGAGLTVPVPGERYTASSL